MYLLYADEVNVDPASTEFFIYGGIAVHADYAAALSGAIDALRAEHGYQPLDPLKFNTVERPSRITAETHREIKREVTATAVEHGVRLFASFILHKIATSPEEARRKEINRICYHFDCFLRREDDYGIVLLDTFNDEKLPGILREKFAVGLRGLPYSPTYRLERVLGFHLASIGSSHFTSVVDIAMGSLRYAVNCMDNSRQHAVARTLLRQLAPMCIRGTRLGEIDEISAFFSPKTVRVPSYQERYGRLREYFEQSGFGRVIAPSQCGDNDG